MTTATLPSAPPTPRYRNEHITRLLEPLLMQVEKPGRYLGLERNTVAKDPASVALRICLAFPDTYEIGMSHAGLKVLYDLMNRRPDVACERVFAPWVDMEREMKAAELPLFSIETRSPVRDFHVLGFSLQSELNYTNIPNMLALAGIPVLAGERADGDALVVGGGPCVANPEPLADFFDAFLIGDAEEALGEMVDAVIAARTRGEKRDGVLLAIARVPGWYVPRFYDVEEAADGTILSIRPNREGLPERVPRRWVETLSADVYPQKPVVPSVEIVQERLGIEVMRGCTQGCRFCQAGYWYRPVRELDPDAVADLTKTLVAEAGWNEVSLLSLSTADYSQIEPLASSLAKDLAPQRVSLSLPSLRADSFNVALADAVSEVRKSGFTFAPETGSDRLRRVINKSFTNADMIAAAEVAFARGWDLIKIYTMIGLPTETDADLDELVILVENILKVARKTPGRKEVKVSVGSFVPKTWTPFQWDAFDGIAELERKIGYLRAKFRRLRGARMTHHEAKGAEIEALLSRGGRRLGRTVRRAAELGAIFDGWNECFRHDLWRQAIAETGIDLERELAARDEKALLPWDVMDISVTKKFLSIERKKGVREMETEDCKWGHCYACGIPGLGEDTVLANPMGALPTLPTISVDTPREVSSGRKAASIRRAELEAKREGKAKNAPYRLREAPAVPSRDQRARPGFGGGATPPAHRTRLYFSKLGEYRFLSHRNVMDCLERALRAAAIPMRYSEGFNPRPRLSFGPALSLGAECWRDPFDLETDEPFTSAHFAAVNAKLPEGLQLVAFEALSVGSATLGRSTMRGVYRLLDAPGEAREKLRRLVGDELRFELPLSGAEATAAKRFFEEALSVPAELVRNMRYVREHVTIE